MTSATGLAPSEQLDPYHYHRRIGEIIRLDADTTFGGGQIPSVFTPQRLPSHEQDGADADAHFLDDNQWSNLVTSYCSAPPVLPCH